MEEFIKSIVNQASKIHGNQMYGNKPYSHHLEQVVRIVVKYTSNRYVLTAAAFHDVLEDTSIDKVELAFKIGTLSTVLVWLVTDEPGANRKERKANTYPKIKRNSDAILIKVADRIANINECIKEGNYRLGVMYYKENKRFHSALFDGQPIWEECLEAFDRLDKFVVLGVKFSG